LIKNIIIFVETPFTERDFDRYGIEIIKSNNFNIFVLNFFPILYPNAYNKIKIDHKFDNLVFDIFTKDEFCTFLEKHKENTLIYNTLNLEIETLFIYRKITKLQLPYFITGLASLPIPSKLIEVGFITRLLNLNFKKVKSRIIKTLPMSYMNLKTSTYLDLVSEKTNYNRPEVTNNTIVIKGHTYDYDIFLNEKNIDSKIVDNKYIVFLDNYLPYHPDNIISNIKSPVTSDIYHNEINSFFNELEKKSGLEVIIAAHPKSQYSDDFNPFNGRKFYKNLTARLVKNSEAVVTTWSTSTNYAILWNKPLIFIITNELKNNNFYNKIIESFANYFNKNPLNVSEIFLLSLNELMHVDLQLYEKYLHDYIKTEKSPDINSWQIKCDIIKNLK
jgi:hypothetical protein